MYKFTPYLLNFYLSVNPTFACSIFLILVSFSIVSIFVVYSKVQIKRWERNIFLSKLGHEKTPFECGTDQDLPQQVVGRGTDTNAMQGILIYLFISVFVTKNPNFHFAFLFFGPNRRFPT